MPKFKVGDAVKIKKMETISGDTLHGFRHGFIKENTKHIIKAIDKDYDGRPVVYVNSFNPELHSYYLGMEAISLWNNSTSKLPSWF